MASMTPWVIQLVRVGMLRSICSLPDMYTFMNLRTVREDMSLSKTPMSRGGMPRKKL